MKKVILSVTLAVLVAVPALAQDHSQHAMPAETSAASTAYMDAMAKMDADMKAMKMTGKPGADFALMMIPHHQSAIDMAKAYLASGENDPELTKLSNDVVAAQEKEIAFLREWLKKNGQ
jgi:uncharacterized protein (DUF305 family)